MCHLTFSLKTANSKELFISLWKILTIMFLVQILSMILIIVFTTQTTEMDVGPKGMQFNDTTTCKEFSKFARFNPNSVLDDQWFVFYYWGPYRTNVAYSFFVPGQAEIAYLHHILDGHITDKLNWTSTLVIMKNLIDNTTALLVKRGDRGEYWHYDLYKNIPKGQILYPADIRIKQTGDNRLLGLMTCRTKIALVMSRIKDVPPQKGLQDAAARLGYRGRGGKSYLYQGSEWMPIPEVDEKDFWRQPRIEEKKRTLA